MNETMKFQAFNQGILETSAVQREALGCLRFLSDGRKFRYSKATAVALAPGVNLQPAAPTANHINLSALATARGSVFVTFSVGATAVTENMYKDGYLQINAGTAGTLGRQYKIKSHSIVSGSGGSITVELDEPLMTALVATTDKLSLIPNPFSGVAVGADAKASAGIAHIAVPASHFFWAQTGGVAAALIPNSTAVGTPLVPGAAGALIAWVGAVVSTTCTIVIPTIGYALETGVTNNYKPIWLTID